MSSLDLLAEARHQAEALGNRVRALELCLGAWATADCEARFLLRRYLRWILEQLDPRLSLGPLLRDQPRELLDLVSAAARSAAPGPAPDAVWTLLVDDQSGEGFVAPLRVGSEATAPGSGLGAEARAAIAAAQRALLTVCLAERRMVASSALRVGDGLVLGGPAAARGWVGDGSSIGAAAAVLLFSRWADREIPAEVAVTGGIDPGGRILPIGDLEKKLRAACRERPWLSRIIIPRGLSPGLEDARLTPVETLGELLAHLFGPSALEALPARLVDIEAMVRLGVELYEKENRFGATLAVLGAALRAIDHRRERGPLCHPREELLALWRAGSASMHLGAVEEASLYYQRASSIGERLWRTGELNPQAYLGFRGSEAVLLRDLFRYDEAEALLRETLSLQRELHQDRREIARTLGNLGELLTLRGRYPEAEAVLQEALGCLRSAYPDEVPRELCYLGNLRLRRADPGAALECYREGLSANRTVGAGAARNEAFLRYGMVRALCRLGLGESAVQQADLALELLPADEPFPRQRILEHRGLALLSLGAWDEGRVDLRHAADLTHVPRGLLRLGAASALAALARHLLLTTSGAALIEVDGSLERIAVILAEVPGLAPRLSLCCRLHALSPRWREEREALPPLLDEVAGLFPY